MAQRTIRRSVSRSGVGLFTGQNVSLCLRPAKVDTGIVINDTPVRAEFVNPSPRCTRLGSVFMIEHLMSALVAANVDNVICEVTGPEVVSGDGSSNLFVEMLEEAGFETQEAPSRVIQIEAPFFVSEGDAHLVVLPADSFQVSYTLSYPKSKLVGTQFYSAKIEWESYKREIAPCRTFSFYEEIAPFIEKGLIKGGGLDNALVIKDDAPMNPGGLRFADEPVRHKVLDLIGDLGLAGARILGHVIAIRSGHVLNARLAQEIGRLVYV